MTWPFAKFIGSRTNLLEPADVKLHVPGPWEKLSTASSKLATGSRRTTLEHRQQQKKSHLLSLEAAMGKHPSPARLSGDSSLSFGALLGWKRNFHAPALTSGLPPLWIRYDCSRPGWSWCFAIESFALKARSQFYFLVPSSFVEVIDSKDHEISSVWLVMFYLAVLIP